MLSPMCLPCLKTSSFTECITPHSVTAHSAFSFYLALIWPMLIGLVGSPPRKSIDTDDSFHQCALKQLEIDVNVLYYTVVSNRSTVSYLQPR